MEESSVKYFSKFGAENTKSVIDAVVAKLANSSIEYIVVASTSGQTALKLYHATKDFNVKIVSPSLHAGFSEPGQVRMDSQMRRELESHGISVFMSSHALSGVNRSITNKFGGTSPLEMVGHTLRLFCGHGLKVCVEISVMAADAGFIPVDEDIIAIGGTSTGADTAVTIRAAHMNNFFDLKIKEILAKPTN